MASKQVYTAQNLISPSKLCICFIGSSAPQSQPQSGQAGADLQAQWAEYYKSLGYAYYGQQGGAQGGAQAPAQGQPQPPAPPPVTSANGEQKVWKSNLIYTLKA